METPSGETAIYSVARGSAGEGRSTYVISDNLEGAASEAKRLRAESNQVGKSVTGLLSSTETRKSAAKGLIVALLTPHLLSALFHLLSSTMRIAIIGLGYVGLPLSLPRLGTKIGGLTRDNFHALKRRLAQLLRVNNE